MKEQPTQFLQLAGYGGGAVVVRTHGDFDLYLGFLVSGVVVVVVASSPFLSALVTGLRIRQVTFRIGSVGGVLSEEVLKIRTMNERASEKQERQKGREREAMDGKKSSFLAATIFGRGEFSRNWFWGSKSESSKKMLGENKVVDGQFLAWSIEDRVSRENSPLIYVYT